MSLRNKRSSAEACYGLGRLLLSAIMMIPLTGELSMCISEYLNSINLCCMSIDEQFTFVTTFYTKYDCTRNVCSYIGFSYSLLLVSIDFASEGLF